VSLSDKRVTSATFRGIRRHEVIDVEHLPFQACEQ
jgi:hypothetical protein